MNAPLTPGQVLAGKYRVERVLGQGGMGVVLQATHLHLGQRVAIKFLYENATPDVVTRFLREARASVRLKSEHVARVLDVGELETGAPYMVMEFLEGSDLSEVLRQRGALSVSEAVEYVLHACEALAEAHVAGIVHRDLKPANLFLTTAADGTHTVKVLDFGISKAASDEPEAGPEMALTKTTAVLGSPLYMAPEQMRSARNVDARADIWSLGNVLYQLVAGQVPFNAATYPELIMMVNMEQPPPLSRFRGDLPAGFEAALLRCLEKDPARRYQNVAELAWAIAPFGPPSAQASAERISRTLGLKMDTTTSNVAPPPAAPPTAPSLTTATTSSAVTASVDATTTTTPPRSRGVFILAGALAVGLIGVVGFVVMGRSPSAASSEAAPESAPSSGPSSVPSAEVRSPPKEPTPSAEAAASANAAPAPSASAATTATTLPAVASPSPQPKAQARPATTAPTPTPAKTAPPKTLQMDIKD